MAGAVLPWTYLGRVDYRAGTGAQAALRDRLLAGDDSAACVLLLEHEPVITLGRHADEANLLVDRATLAARGVAVERTTRGGDVTYHGPGQLVVYPVLRLRAGVVAFLEATAAALVELVAALGVPDAAWRRDPAGVWVGPNKLAACGIHVSRRVCAHGFALNVSTPEDMWRLIVPCGLRDHGVTSLARERAARGLSPPPPVAEVAAMAGPLLGVRLAAQHA